MQPEQQFTQPPIMPPQPIASPPSTPPPPPKPSFLKRFGPLLLGVILPLVLAGVVGYVYVQDRRDNPKTPNQSQAKQQPQNLKPIDTPNGRRYASVQAITDLDNAKTLADAHKVTQQFLDQYDLQLHTTEVKPSEYVQEHDTFRTLEEGDLAAFKAYAKVFVDEWAKYPQDWVRESNLKHIMIIKNLTVGDTERAATPDPVGDAVYYDIGYGADIYAREVIHHEYNHQIEYEHFDSYSRDDSTWAALNPAGFTYNPQGGVAAYYDDSFNNEAHPEDGFVNRYATYGIEEDKAEIYAYLLTRPYNKDLAQWIKTDTKLAQKVQLYKAFMRSVSPDMNDDYFAAINP
jgi:hypothetical protein